MPHRGARPAKGRMDLPTKIFAALIIAAAFAGLFGPVIAG
jgi:hypothetical protein